MQKIIWLETAVGRGFIYEGEEPIAGNLKGFLRKDLLFRCCQCKVITKDRNCPRCDGDISMLYLVPENIGKRTSVYDYTNHEVLNA
jgi:hypothetical protein